MTPGPLNALCDVGGLAVGHYTDIDQLSGCTVIHAPDRAVCGVAVMGSAPGTRETDLLDPRNLVEKVDAVLLSGGSVYGLACADGVVRGLAEAGKGFPLPDDMTAPIVPGAVLYDLGRGGDFPPHHGPDWGRTALETANANDSKLGNIGAGIGAMSGGIKGGLGQASLVLKNGLTVSALVAVNSLGSVIDPYSGLPWELSQALPGDLPEDVTPRKLPEPETGEPGANTTIAVVAVDSVLSKAQAGKVAAMAHDGMARSIRPAHTMFDGDTVFALATGLKPLPRAEGFFEAQAAPAINEIGHAAALCLSRAIMRGVILAETTSFATAWRDLASKG